MGRILAIANQKGGVGKTTTSVNLAAAMATTGKKILLVDMDPQGNATMGSGVDKHEIEYTAHEIMLDSMQTKQVLHRSEQGGFDVLPSNGDLTAAEVELMDAKMRDRRLRLALEQVRGDYDYILIDCPPSLSMLTVNALVAADGVLIPMQCEYYALEGLSALLNTIEKIREALNPSLEIDGLLRTMFDARNNLANQVSAQLIMHFNDQVYRTVIPRNVRLAEAPSHGSSVLQYDRGSRGAMAYMALGSEIIRRDQKKASSGTAVPA